MNKIMPFIIIIYLGLIGCKETPVTPLLPSVKCNVQFTPLSRIHCEYIPPSGNLGGYTYIISDSMVFHLNSNPANEEEVIFTLQVEVPISGAGFRHNYELWKMNICTGEKTILMDKLFGSVRVGRKGGILINLYNNQIWAINTNGDSLMHMTEGTGPRWHPDKKSFSFIRDGVNGNVHHLIMDFESRKVDTVKMPHGRIFNFEWSSTGDSIVYHFFENNINGLKLLDLNSHKEEILIQDNYHNSFSIRWPSQSTKVYWLDHFDMYEYDLVRHTKRLLFEGCNGDFASHISILPNGKEMILNWRKETVIRAETLLKETFLLRMNITNPDDLEKIEFEW